MSRREFFHLPTPRNSILALLIAAPALAMALERETSFSVEYCNAWTSTGTRNDGCFVDTDIMLTSNSVVEVDLEVTDTSATVYLFSAGPSYQLSSTGTQWQFHYGGTAAANTAKGGEVVKNRRYVVKTSPQGIYVDGELAASRTPLNFTPPNALRLFSQATSNWNRGHLRFFWMKIYEPDDNGVLHLEHELRPCMIVGGRMGIYDELGEGVWANGQTYRELGGPLVVPAPNGVGSVEGLTNALLAVKRLPAVALETCVKLEPGTYNLAGITNGNNHLVFAGKSADTPAGLYLAGMGDSPADTILLGGGQADGRRVIQINSLTISNLTVTGGYLSSASDGGGVIGYGYSGYGTIVDCILSNNYTKGSNGAGGGAAWGIKTMRRCLVADNRSGQRGGGLRDVSLVEDCVISNNLAEVGGGTAGCNTYRCLFIGNKGKYNGGGQSEGVATDCIFTGNVAHYGGNYGAGGGLHSAIATNCVFVGNGDNRSESCYGSAASNSRLVGCTITNSFARRSIFNLCRLQRCLVSDVSATHVTDVYNFLVFGRSEGKAIYTNVNCIIENVVRTNAIDRLAKYSVFVNCTIRNVSGKKNGPLDSDCAAVNTIMVDCAPYDVTASTAPVMKNCLYQTASGEFAEGRLVDCIQANPRFETDDNLPYLTIRRSSPAYNAGFEDDWLLNLVGDTDFAGNPRRLFGRIDIGALERQSDKLPGLRLSVQ